MTEVSPWTPSHIPSLTSTFRCSGDDPVLRDLITHALRASPWITVDTSAIRIHWRPFFEQWEKNNSLSQPGASSLKETLLSHLEEMGETYGLSLFAPGQLSGELPADTTDHMSGLVITRQSADLSPQYVTWFETYKDLAERLLYEWDEALKLKTSPSRSQHMHNRIIPNLRVALRVAGSTQYATLKRVLYPLAARLRLGAALPTEIEAVTRVSAGQSGEKGRFLPLMQAYAQGVQALHQAWTHIRETSTSSPHSHPQMWLFHPTLRNLVSKNKTLAHLVYQRSLYGCDVGGTPKRAEGYGRIEKSYYLVDRDQRPTKKLPIEWPFLADRVLHQMCQALRDFCTYFYSYDPSDGSHARRVLDQIIRIERAIPRPKLGDVETREFSEADTVSLGPDFLPLLDDLIECLLEQSPLLVILATGMLSTYEMPSTGEWGFALGPQLIATILAERGLGGALPFQYIRPHGPDSHG